MTKTQMTIRQFDALLQKHIDNRDFIKLKRTVTKGESDIGGFILKMSRKLLLIQKEEEFYLNGYVITPKDHFDAIRCNTYEKTFKRILKAEGITNKDYGITDNINLDSWEAAFGDLKRLDYHVIIECEDLEEPLFLIGPITKVTTDSLSIRNFDPAGLSDPKPTAVKYKDITLVQFGIRYINVFRKYIRAPRQKRKV